MAYYEAQKPLLVILNPMIKAVDFEHPIFRKPWSLVSQLQNSSMSAGFEFFESGFKIQGLSYAVLNLNEK